ncbi:MAG: peptidase M64 [Candidatus Krumholzibacteriota bacterium]|nr:peptidase M64 [Candidatus Krumholzibacteriota bacterium]
MRRLLLAALMLTFAVPAAAGSGYDRFFTGEALRIDFYHTGTADTEIFSLDELVREAVWAGNPRALVDTMNLGGYLVRVLDVETNRQIFSRGYCTVFGEWVTTDEADAGFTRTFHESVIVPFPKGRIQVRIDRRDRENVFRTVWDIVVDPSDVSIRNDRRFRDFKVRTVQETGPPGSRVDLLILGDGYRRDQLHKLRGDVERFVGAFFDTEPFRSRRKDFNVRYVECVSEDSGVDDPRAGKYVSNILGLSFNSLGIDRYMISTHNRTIRDIAAAAPYDLVMLLANEEKYGGGGIFRLYSNCISDNEWDVYVFVHEFGHAFAGLADEYYSSQVTYNEMYPRGVEPWEPNITALLDPGQLKWRDLATPGAAIPTPADSTLVGVVGAFEGAGYSAKGLYRPCLDCRMFSKGLTPFCPVCRRAIERMIDFHTK